MSTDQIYCSVDLEFTGFDPERDQILEIGFAFFKVSENGFEVIERWDQVFKPNIEVHPKILGLTGITQEELDAAPEFNEYREFLQEKLGDAIIVGHNPVMDVKFLEAYGIKLSGRIIDTLELVQFILPTHHSYNLENLVHYFGIQHDENHHAHRALADALATTKVLENLVRIYQNFSSKLKEALVDVMARGDFEWKALLNSPITSKKIEKNDSLQQIHAAKQIPLLLSEKLVTIDTAPTDHEGRVALGLQSKTENTMIVVSDSNTVMRLWKDGLVHGVFTKEDTFSKSAFNHFLEHASSPEELRFSLKILVWLHVNWQTEVILDLNISFFGGQFRNFITGGKPKSVKQKIVCVDYNTFHNLNHEKDFQDFNLVVCDLQSFEKFMSSGLGERLSWMGILYPLKNIYNPETDLGNLAVKDMVVNALTATDLFFGLAYMLLSKSFPGKEHITISELSRTQDHVLSRLQKAAENLKEKLILLESKVSSPELVKIANRLDGFFYESDNRVKWINIDERNLSFHDQPIDIAPSVKKQLGLYKEIKFTDTVTNSPLLSYYTDRLGFHTEPTDFPNDIKVNKLLLNCFQKKLSEDDLYELMKRSALPMIVALQSQSDIKNFYNNHYLEIKKNAALFAQGYSGGGNKMFRNFSINENSVLLATADFIAKQNYSISAKTVIFSELPAVDVAHPYTLALLDYWKKQFPDLKMLLAYSKITAAIKKIKLNTSVDVQVYNFPSNVKFVDK